MSYAIHLGDVLDRLREMPSESVHCVVTSPPYWGLRDYGLPPSTWPDGWVGCLGLEPTPDLFLAHMVSVFDEVRRVLRADGTCWVNMGDSYASQPNQRVQNGEGRDDVAGWKQASNKGSCGVGSRAVPGLKPKDLVGMPWMLAFALRASGWWLRQDIIWAKPNPMPESVTDRCTKAHEYIFLLTKSAKYFYDAEAIKEPANGWNNSRFDDGKNAVIHPTVGKNRTRGQQSWTAASGLVGHPQRDSNGGVGGDGATRNKRDVWEIATESFPEAHFATFPTKLVEPCILAGTSDKGCCETCGAPWVRIYTKELVPAAGAAKTFIVDARDAAADSKDQGSNRQKDGHKPGWVNETTTTGWKPTCKCEAGVVPCTVADIFNGSGTTGVVAKRLGRNYLGIELNPEYREMALRRIHDDNPMFNVRTA